jgi:radical SAM superfamily enzyme YgiQ (UPF0313 family)
MEQQQLEDEHELTEQKRLDHDNGTCRPCVFFRGSRGCHNGPSCSFCHLPGHKRAPRPRRRRRADGSLEPPDSPEPDDDE